jgi:hypothetical protein
MERADAKRFRDVMFAMAEAFSQQATAFKVEIYYKALADMEIGDIERGCWQIIRTRGTATFPKVAEIREAVMGDSASKAELAWGSMIKAVRSIGPYRSVVFDDPVIHAVVDREGGWERVCEKTIDEMKWFGKDFPRIYKTFEEAVLNGSMAVPPVLIGIHDGHNQAHGFTDHVREPVAIGDGRDGERWQGQLSAARARAAAAMSSKVVAMVAGTMGEKAIGCSD